MGRENEIENGDVNQDVKFLFLWRSKNIKKY